MQGDSSKKQENIFKALTNLSKALIYQPKQINTTVAWSRTWKRFDVRYCSNWPTSQDCIIKTKNFEKYNIKKYNINMKFQHVGNTTWVKLKFFIGFYFSIKHLGVNKCLSNTCIIENYSKAVKVSLLLVFVELSKNKQENIPHIEQN